MLTAELLKPNRLNAHGRTWERGVQVPVDLTTARLLSKNPRFQVNGLFEALDAIASGKTLDELGIREAPAPEDTQEEEVETEEEGGEKSLSDRIREAADGLDVDDESNFGSDGKPTVEALSKVLDEEITVEQRDAAIAPPARQVQLESEAKPAATSNRTLRIKTGSKPRPSKKPNNKPKPAQAEEKSVEV